MTDDELLALANQQTEYNDGIGAWVSVYVINGQLVIRHEDGETRKVTVGKWWLVDAPE